MYKFKPILKTLVWGTENWVLSGVSGSESVVAEGPHAGKKLSEVVPGEFPLLIKFIDAHDNLSVQVHPDDALARKRHGCNGKTEMWYVTGVGPGAHLLSGLGREISPDEYPALVRSGAIVDALCDYRVAPGDVFFLPAGRIHAIGGGCRLAEIQQTSDITYRIYDYGRMGLDGKPRELHTELAKDAIDYSVQSDYRTAYEPCPESAVELVRCPYFTTSLLDISAPLAQSLAAVGPFLIAICFEGAVTLKDEAGESVRIREGEVALVMRESGSVTFIPEGHSKLLTTHI